MTSSPITRQMGLWCACLCSHQLMVATFSTRISGQASWKKAYVLLDKPSVKLSLIRYCPVHETYGWIWFSWIVRPSQVVISCQADFFFYSNSSIDLQYVPTPHFPSYIHIFSSFEVLSRAGFRNISRSKGKSQGFATRSTLLTFDHFTARPTFEREKTWERVLEGFQSGGWF